MPRPDGLQGYQGLIEEVIKEYSMLTTASAANGWSILIRYRPVIPLTGPHMERYTKAHIATTAKAPTTIRRRYGARRWRLGVKHAMSVSQHQRKAQGTPFKQTVCTSPALLEKRRLGKIDPTISRDGNRQEMEDIMSGPH